MIVIASVVCLIEVREFVSVLKLGKCRDVLVESKHLDSFIYG